jgi:hypothetical protein
VPTRLTKYAVMFTNWRASTRTRNQVSTRNLDDNLTTSNLHRVSLSTMLQRWAFPLTLCPILNLVFFFFSLASPSLRSFLNDACLCSVQSWYYYEWWLVKVMVLILFMALPRWFSGGSGKKMLFLLGKPMLRHRI